MDEGPARAVLAGFIVGYAAGIAFTAVAAWLLPGEQGEESR